MRERSIVHTVELLDWATGGPIPQVLSDAGLAGRTTEPARVAAE